MKRRANPTKLDEIEKLASAYHRACKLTGNTGTQAGRLARALLAALPVLRAAEGLRPVHDQDELVSNAAPISCDCALCAAVDAMRAALENI